MPSRVHRTGGNQHGSSPEEAADNLRLKGLRESAEGLRIDRCQGDHRGKIGWGWGWTQRDTGGQSVLLEWEVGDREEDGSEAKSPTYEVIILACYQCV